MTPVTTAVASSSAGPAPAVRTTSPVRLSTLPSGDRGAERLDQAGDLVGGAGVEEAGDEVEDLVGAAGGGEQVGEESGDGVELVGVEEAGDQGEGLVDEVGVEEAFFFFW